MVENVDKCHACGQNIVVYKRSIRSNMLAGLIALKYGCKRTIELPIPVGARSDFTTLQHWRLIRKAEFMKDSWELTEQGRLFLEGDISVPKFVFLFNNHVQKFSLERLWVKELEDTKISKETVLNDAVRVDEVAVI